MVGLQIRPFSEVIKSERKKTFKSSKQFFDSMHPNCSYNHYCLIERGKLPDIKLAIEIIKLLQINLKFGIDAWLTSFLPTEESKSLYINSSNLISNIKGDGPSALKSVLVINRFQANFILDHPLSYDVMCYLNTHNGAENTLKKISTALNLPPEKTSFLLENMTDICILDKEDNIFKIRDHFVIPRENKLDDLQHLIFQKSYDNYFESSDPNKIRLTLFCNLTKSQAEMVSEKMRDLRNWIWELEKKSEKECSKPYFMGMFNAEKIYTTN